MRLLDTYATNTGSKIDKPFIFEKFFPLPCEKYITLQAQTPYDSRNYEYWQDVIDILYPILEKENIKILHTGLPDEKKLKNVIDILGQTNVNQLAHIIKNSLLHFGADSFGVHLASYYDKPIVSLYSISNPNVAGPHFGDKNKHILIRAYENIGNKKPSYSQTESPKCINTVKPEQIATSVLKLLNLNTNIGYETLFIGNRYTHKIIESIGDQIVPPDFIQTDFLNIRLDYIKEITQQTYKALLNNLNIRKCSLITDKPFNVQPLFQFKDNLNIIFYNVTNGVDLKFIDHVKSFGFKIFFVFELLKSNQEILLQRKLEMIDINQNIEIVTQKDLPQISDYNNLFYKTNKLLVGNNKIYLSKAAFEANKPITNLGQEFMQPLSDINNIESFLTDDSAYCSIIKKD